MSDADFAKDPLASNSVSGVCSFIASNLVGWSSCKQTRVAQSTCEAEALSCLDGINELEYLGDLLRELKLDDSLKAPSTVFNDNQGCLASVEDGGAFKRNKHYRIRLNRCRAAVREGLCAFKYRPTSEMTADGLTKQLDLQTIFAVLEFCKPF